MDNRKAFLDTLAFSEIGAALLKVSDNGYNVIVGSTPLKPILFDSYADHPRRLIALNPTLSSTAAGRYQLLARWFDAYKKQLNLPDFSPESQDIIALQQIKEQGALADIDAGRFDIAVSKVRKIWASLPGAGYGQRENKLEILRAQFKLAGGMLA